MAWLSTTILADQWLGYNGSTTNATLIDMAVDMAEGEIERYLNQPVVAQSKDLFFGGAGRACHVLPYTTAVTLSTVLYRNEPQDSFTPVSGTPAVYQDGLLWFLDADGIFAKGVQYKATVTAGWASGDIPDDVKLSGYELAKEIVLETVKGQIGPDRFGLSAITEGEGGVSLSKAIVQQVDRMRKRLGKYRWVEI